jgi:hypothetical protein
MSLPMAAPVAIRWRLPLWNLPLTPDVHRAKHLQRKIPTSFCHANRQSIWDLLYLERANGAAEVMLDGAMYQLGIVLNV